MNKQTKQKLIRIITVLVIAICAYFYDEYFKEETSPVVEYREEKQVNKDITNLSIHFVDVGQGDCILITQNNENMLIDAGNNEDGDLLVDYFKDLGIKDFKYVVGTHAHEDHIGGLDNIIENFNIGKFYMPDVITTTKTFEDVLDALLEKNKAFGKEFKMGELNFKVLHVGNDKSDLNNTSIVLKMTYKNTSYLFMGDATDIVEKKLVNDGVDLKSDVLKVGHHGSQYSTTQNFLNEVKPNYAVIQVGEGNTYDHPKQITLDRLNKLNIKTYRNDESGTIILTSDGENINFETIKTNTNG